MVLVRDWLYANGFRALVSHSFKQLNNGGKIIRFFSIRVIDSLRRFHHCWVKSTSDNHGKEEQHVKIKSNLKVGPVSHQIEVHMHVIVNR